MHTKTLIAHIESTAPLLLAAPWDKSGVQVASDAAEVKTMCVALDPSLDTVRQAVERKADFLLCHHPLTLSPRLPSHLDDFHQVLSLSLGSRMWVYSAHTSLDANPRGPVNWLGRALDLPDMRILEVTRRETPTLMRLDRAKDQDALGAFSGAIVRRDAGQPEYLLWPEEVAAFRSRLAPGDRCQEIALAAPSREFGFGCIGTLPQPLPWTEFSGLLAGLGISTTRTAGPTPSTVASVAYCPGSGADLAPLAFRRGADVFLTGDLKYHQAQAAQDLGLTVDVGHFCLEETMMRIWSEDLARELSPAGLEVVFLPGRDPFA
jgi:dinuclear metal center YbgI/SA1388 family protein